MDALRKGRWNYRWMRAAPAVFAWVFALSVTAAERSKVREKVQFSAPGEAVEAPTSRPREELSVRSFELLGGANSISGVVAPMVAPAPNYVPRLSSNPRLMEALDQKRNWVYVRSGDTQRDPTADEILGVRDSRKMSEKPKTVLENYFEDRGGKASRERARKEPGKWNRDEGNKLFDDELGTADRGETNTAVRFDNPWDSTQPVTAGFSMPSSVFGAPAGQGAWNGARDAGSREAFPGGWGAQDRSDDFRKLLIVPGTANPLLRAFDPINLRVDTTRQLLNPIVGQPGGGLPGAGGNTFNDLPSPASSLNPSSLFSDPGSRPVRAARPVPALAP